jgi:ABC-2 type transport system ATP-binding protein
VTLLEMRDAAFVRGNETIVSPLTCSLAPGERSALRFESTREAATVALMAAGIVKASSGRIFIGEFDPRIQPVQAKRIVGYVPHEAVPHEFATFFGYIEYRSALWGLQRERSIADAAALLETLRDVHEAFAYPLIGALIARPALLVLDRPQAAYAPQILTVAGDCAVFSTHVSQREATSFARSRAPDRAQA